MRDPDDPQEVLEFPSELFILRKHPSERFPEYHAANPEIYEELERLALAWFEAGRSHCGARMLVEVVRYNTGLRAGGDPYKVNNDYAPYYARLIMEKNPELEGFFEIRKLHT